MKGYTSNATVHALFRNLCAAIFACNAAELPARAFLTYFTSKGAFKKFGFCPQGTIGVWNSLGTAIKRNGDIWLGTPATTIHTANGKVEGVTVLRNGEKVRIDTDLVVSNAGPKATVALAGSEAFPADYIARVNNDLRPAANIVINVASPRAADQSSRHRHLRQDAPALQHGQSLRDLSGAGSARLAPLCRLCRAGACARRFRL